MNIFQFLKSLSGYPIPSNAIENVVEGVGLVADTELTPEIRSSREYKKAQGEIYLFLSEAPNVSQGGISFSFSPEERRNFRLRAESLFDEIGESLGSFGVEYGYKGEDL